MLSAILSRIIILVCGVLYPAYASFKAVRSKDVKEYVKWMMYWIVFAFFTTMETFTDVFLSWAPFYYEIKVLLVAWLLSPITKGSSILYKKFVHPTLISKEQEIDEYLNKAREQGYKQFLDLSYLGVNAILNTALKGSSQLIYQLRRSYSLNDLSEITGDGSLHDETDSRCIAQTSESCVQRITVRMLPNVKRRHSMNQAALVTEEHPSPRQHNYLPPNIEQTYDSSMESSNISHIRSKGVITRSQAAKLNLDIHMESEDKLSQPRKRLSSSKGSRKKTI